MTTTTAALQALPSDLTRTDIARCYREATGATRFSETDEIFARLIERRVHELALSAPPAAQDAPSFDMLAHLQRQAAFSARTFGPGPRVQGVTDHIAKELQEVRDSGGSLAEWVDVIILAFDGAWRSGATPEEIIAAMVAKQARNEGRTWPDWRTADPNKAIEHDRSGEAALASQPATPAAATLLVPPAGAGASPRAVPVSELQQHAAEAAAIVSKLYNDTPDVSTAVQAGAWMQRAAQYLAAAPAAHPVAGQRQPWPNDASDRVHDLIGQLAAKELECQRLREEAHAAPTAPQAPAPTASAGPQDAHRFKNFHRSLCARFGYTHDEQYWWRDLVSLEEHIAAKVTAPQAPALVALTEHHKLDNHRQVFFYEQDFYVLSNFSSFALHWKGLDFPTSEHAYHWEKFNMRGEQQAECRNRIHGARSAHDAFKVAAELKPFRRAAWDELKVGIMRDILRAKAQQHEYVRRKLLATGDRELIEDSWRDDYWGWGPNRDGQNMLGKLWMEVRAELYHGIGIAPTTKEQQA